MLLALLCAWCAHLQAFCALLCLQRTVLKRALSSVICSKAIHTKDEKKYVAPPKVKRKVSRFDKMDM